MLFKHINLVTVDMAARKATPSDHISFLTAKVATLNESLKLSDRAPIHDVN